MPAIIVLGDKTDHGGEVIEASAMTSTHGKRMARVGDKVYCPKKGHNDAVIVTGDMSFVIDGKAVAYHGCKTSCGATLISSQAVTTVAFGGAAGSSAVTSIRSGATQAAVFASAMDMAEDDSDAAELLYDERIIAVDPATGVPIPGLAYLVKTSSGKVFRGFTNEAGLVPRISTESEEALTVWFGIGALHVGGEA